MNSHEQYPNACIIVPLGGEAHAMAGQFAAEQATPDQGKRVYLNTLAVYAVHSYLKWLQIETELSQSDSWHPSLQTLSDVADLVLPGIGKLECRPVLPGETTFLIPPQAMADTIGCVAVQFSESLDEVQLLGFVRPVDTSTVATQLAIANLQPLDVLLDYIPDVVDRASASTASKISGNLSCWLENIFEAGWQTVEALFSTQAAHPASIVRSAPQLREINADNPALGVKRGKLIDLGVQLVGHPVALIVTVTPAEADEEVNVRLQVYPLGRQICLPPNLQLLVLDETGASFPELEVTARNEDNCIQLELSGQPGEQFSVKVALGDVSITEDFLI
jgi:hypothetical protein